MQRATSCTSCKYPGVRLSREYQECSGINLDVSSVGTASISVVIVLIYLIGVFYIDKGDGSIDINISMSLFAYTALPAIDTVTDLQYLISNEFASVTLFSSAMIFYFAPMFVFFLHPYIVF